MPVLTRGLGFPASVPLANSRPDPVPALRTGGMNVKWPPVTAFIGVLSQP